MTTQDRAPDELADFAELMRVEEDFSGHRGQPDPLRRVRIRRVLIAVAAVFGMLFAGAGSYVGWALNSPVSAPVVTSQVPAVPAPVAAQIALPADGATAVSVAGAEEYFGAAGTPLALASGSDEPRSIASISKLVTALVVLDAHPLASADDPGPTITFGKAAHDLYDKYYVMGATIEEMPTGSSMSLRDALATMLIPSACNYAEAVSTWAFGSQSGFLRATRDWLTVNGLAGTTIVEPTGIDPRNTSTPSDLIAIAKLASANPAIAAIAATPSLTLPAPGRMTNTNSLLGGHGVTGLKTGNLGAGSFTLLYTASLGVGLGQPLGVTGVVLGGGSRESVDHGVIASLDSIRAGFHDVPLVSTGQELGTYTTPWGSSARMVVGEDASIFTWSDTPITVSMQTTTPTTYTQGEVVGQITWTAGPNTATTPVTIDGTIAPPTDWWRLTHPAELGAP
ncbi:D-alanyl-D-alanine carboxypeptidase [Microbacterium sp. SS28]|uniref:D-alanyl-D-alanine carboxypeptidase n=1 Tax=Microbacterium sp. SS28 TaxID=2919948 RepID=UPI001FAACB72|nr:D-alanyl-D-alanine carboxypeptidase [Microbacterium sp. SS28]